MTDALWTILIPTLGQRAKLFDRLMGQLLPQVDKHEGAVRVVGFWNNGDPPLADIRQELVQSCTTPYLSFFDDDDEPAPDFVDRVMEALEQRPDYVGWQTAYSSDGVDHGLVDHSLRYGGWYEVKKPTYQLLRDITHINPMRAEVAKRGDFRKKTRAGRAEDRPWVDQIRATNALKTEVYLPGPPMYFYRWRRDTSAWQRPHLIDRTPRHRPTVPSPHFTWHRRSAGIATTPDGDTVAELLIIIPTRGRPQNVERVIKAWENTGAFEVARVLFAVDEDDPELATYLEYGTSDLAKAGKVAVIVREREPMAKRTNTEAALFAPQFFALGSAGDDHVPETAGWAQRYLEELKRLGSGVVHGDDGFQHGKLCTEWAMTSDIVRALDGRLIPAPVDHLYADNSVMDLARTANMLSYLPDVKITHYNPYAHKDVPKDEGYERVNSGAQYARDGETFKRWRRQQLPADVSKLRALAPLVAPAAMPSGRPKGARHRTALGVQRGGVVNSRPATRLDRTRKDRPVTMNIPRHIRKVRGLTSDEALVALADMARQVPADQAIVELGVYQGKSALCLAWGASQGEGAHVWAIDPWDLSETGEDLAYLGLGKGYSSPNHKGTRRWAEWNVQSLGYKRAITLVHGWSGLEGQAWQGPPVGLLFVDGDHTFQGAQADLLSWADHLAPGATVVFDDYVSSQEDVVRAVDELVQVGILERPELHAGRLAVTRLTEGWAERRDTLVDETTAAPTLGDVPHPVSVEYVDPEHGLVKGIVSPGEGLLDFTPDPEGDRRPGDGEDDPAWDGVAEPTFVERLLEETDPSKPLSEETVRAARLLVQEGPESDVTTAPAGASIEDLNTVQLRALAKARGIKLGVRKDKRDLMIAALRDGE